MAFKKIAKVDELWDGEMQGFIIDNQKIILINENNCVYAFEDKCCHQQVALSKGTFVDGIITCPAHHWQYDVKGCGVNPKGTQLKVIPVKIDNGNILVDTDTP